jgi:hypothetical protein
MVKRLFVVQGITCVMIVLQNLPDPSQIKKKDIKCIKQKKNLINFENRSRLIILRLPETTPLLGTLRRCV